MKAKSFIRLTHLGAPCHCCPPPTTCSPRPRLQVPLISYKLSLMTFRCVRKFTNLKLRLSGHRGHRRLGKPEVKGAATPVLHFMGQEVKSKKQVAASTHSSPPSASGSGWSRRRQTTRLWVGLPYQSHVTSLFTPKRNGEWSRNSSILISAATAKIRLNVSLNNRAFIWETDI